MAETDKISQDEMIKMFGEAVPIEAVNILFNSNPEMTVGAIRAELRRLAGSPARWKAREMIRRLCEDPEMWATHGCPPDHKLKRLEDEITAAIEVARSAEQCKEELGKADDEIAYDLDHDRSTR